MAKNNPKNKQNKNKLEQKGNNKIIKIIPKYKQNHNKTNTHSNTHLINNQQNNPNKRVITINQSLIHQKSTKQSQRERHRA
jgi:hypothetical protein